MTLLDSKPVKPPSKLRKYLPLIILVAVIAGSVATYALWDYPEERAVARFLTALEQGNYEEAYRLWQPSASYSFQDFLHDWGEKGDYGKIREFAMVSAKSRGSTTVVVAVRINGVDPPLSLLVDRTSKGLAYSPF